MPAASSRGRTRQGDLARPAARGAGTNVAAAARRRLVLDYDRAMTLGSVLAEAWGLYTRFFTRFFLLAAVVFLITNLASSVLAESVGANSSLSAFLVGVAAFAVIIVGSFWLQGAFVLAVQDVRDGSFDATTDQIFQKVKPFLGQLVLAGFLGALGIAAGMILLVVPGLVLLTWWALLSPVLVLEHTGVGGAFARSRELVRGHGWTVFGVMLATGLLSLVADSVLTGILGFLPGLLGRWIGGALSGAIVAPFGAIAVTIMYFKLVERRAAADA